MEQQATETAQRTVWKFPLKLMDSLIVSMPRGAKILHFGMQGEVPTLWALVDPDHGTVQRHFRLAGTGHPLGDPNSHLTHIGTCFQGPFVWHLFEAQP